MSDLASQIAGLPADKLQALLQRVREKKGRARPLGIPLADRSAGHLPVSFAQRRLWFLHQLEPQDPSYNLAIALELAGELVVPALTAALAELVRRHEVLRTTFAVREGEPVQVVTAASGWTLPLVDLAELTAGLRQSAAARLAAEAAARPFDLANGPLLRSFLLRLEPRRHLLLLAFHHVVFDAWSMGVLLDELSRLYGACALGRPSPLPAPPIQYADFAAWQRRELTGEIRDAQLAYWRERLAGQPMLDLPADRPRGRRGGPRGGRYSQTLPTRLAGALKQLADSESATLFMVLLAGFLVLLQRYIGRDDLSVGVPTAGRRRAEVENLIGCFVNLLVFRTDLAGAASFRDLLRRVRATALDAYAHQDLPFECLVEALQPVRSSETTPLFQVVFQLKSTRNLKGDPLRLGELSLTVQPIEMQRAQFDLSVEVDEDASGLLLVGEYDRGRFEAVRMLRLFRHLEKLLEEAAADPSRRPEELPILTPAERQQLLGEWNPRESIAAVGTLHGRFAAWAARTPDAIAVVSTGERITYGELDRRAGRLAGRLRAAGAGPESRVAICLERSARTVVAILAVLKAGAAYVPIDPRFPEERVDLLLGDSGARALVSELPRGGTPRCCGLAVLLVDEEEETGGGPAAPFAELPPPSAAYVIYTSGSTGQPKGVVVSHANVLRLFAATERWFDFSPADAWACFHSFAFDFSVWEMWGALLHGGRLVIAPYWVSRSPDAFYELLLSEQVSILSQTPSAFLQLSQEDDQRGGGVAPALRAVVFGGEALDPAALLPWLARHGAERPRLINMYGITEITVHATYGPVAGRDPAGDLGRPLPDLALYLLDRSLQPVPIGVPGEIYVGGPGVARGYLDRPARTAERFLPDPWAHRPGDRLYRSGDRARHLPQGGIEYLGRLDEQVKIRGFRIEPAEVEAALRRHPAVADAAVVAHRSADGQQELVAYLVGRGDWDGAGVREFLRQRLPEPMVPAHVILLPSLPLTVNGKLDRAALPAPDGRRPDDGVSHEPPRTQTEHLIAEIWADVLRLDRIGADDNFFDLGGHSLNALRVISRAVNVYGRPIPAATIFQSPTVRQLARWLDEHLGAEPESPLIPFRVTGSRPPLVLVHPVGGNVLCYRELANSLPGDQPVYAIAARGLDGDQEPTGDVVAMAASYLATIAELSRDRPVVLGGWSMGGLIAYEMARQLQRDTARVVPVVMLDSYVPTESVLKELDGLAAVDDTVIVADFAYDWGQSLGIDFGLRAADLAGLSARQKIDRLVARAVALGVIGSGDDTALVERLVRVFGTNVRAIRGYRPQAGYSGPIAVFTAAGAAAGPKDPAHGWRECTAGPVDVRPVPGDHYSILREPNIPLLTAELRDCLDHW